MIINYDCSMCAKKMICKKLCPPMQAYADQDQIDPGRERPRAPEIIGRRRWPETPQTPGRNEMAFKLFFIDRLTAAEIAETLYISERHARRIVSRGRALMHKNLQK